MDRDKELQEELNSIKEIIKQYENNLAHNQKFISALFNIIVDKGIVSKDELEEYIGEARFRVGNFILK